MKEGTIMRGTGNVAGPRTAIESNGISMYRPIMIQSEGNVPRIGDRNNTLTPFRTENSPLLINERPATRQGKQDSFEIWKSGMQKKIKKT